MTSISPEEMLEIYWATMTRGWRKDDQGNYVILISERRGDLLNWITLQNPNEWQRIGAIGFKYMLSPQLETAFLLRWS